MFIIYKELSTNTVLFYHSVVHKTAKTNISTGFQLLRHLILVHKIVESAVLRIYFSSFCSFHILWCLFKFIVLVSSLTYFKFLPYVSVSAVWLERIEDHSGNSCGTVCTSTVRTQYTTHRTQDGQKVVLQQIICIVDFPLLCLHRIVQSNTKLCVRVIQN